MIRAGHLERDWGRLGYVVLDERDEQVVWLCDFNQHPDLCMTDPDVAAAISSLARDDLGTMAVQERGIGNSSPVARPATPEEHAADVLAMLDAEGVERCTLVGCLATCLPAALIAARHPERVNGLVLISPLIAGPLAADGRWGWTPEVARECVESYRRLTEAEWGSGNSIALWEPGLGSPVNRRLIGLTERCACSPEFAGALFERTFVLDGRDVYAQVRVPTRVVRPGGQVIYAADAVRAVADAIEGATYHELPTNVLGDSIGNAWSVIARHAAELARGEGARYRISDDVLVSVLFTDIVDSTAHVARLGDAAWSDVREAVDQLTKRETAQAGGRYIHTTGDGALCEFPDTVAAVRCGEAIVTKAPELGVQVRAGVHVGECQRVRDDLTGLAVNACARVCSAAGAGEVLVSRAVRDLATGAGLEFAPRGEHDLKGVPGRWELFAASRPLWDERPEPIPAEPTPLDRLVVRAARRSPGSLRIANRLAVAAQRRLVRR